MAIPLHWTYEAVADFGLRTDLGRPAWSEKSTKVVGQGACELLTRCVSLFLKACDFATAQSLHFCRIEGPGSIRDSLNPVAEAASTSIVNGAKGPALLPVLLGLGLKLALPEHSLLLACATRTST